jgi:hypothetical protein
MLHYLQAWLPLLSVALGAGICFGIASFIIDSGGRAGFGRRSRRRTAAASIQYDSGLA